MNHIAKNIYLCFHDQLSKLFFDLKIRINIGPDKYTDKETVETL